MTDCRLLPRLLLLTGLLVASPVGAQDIEFFPERTQRGPHRDTPPSAPEPLVPVDSIYYDDGDNFIDYSYSFSGADALYLAVRFETASDFELTHVRFWGRKDGETVSGDVMVDVYDGTGATPAGSTLLTSQTYPDLLTPSSQFRYVGLDTPLSFGAGEAFFIVVRAEASPEQGGPLGGDLGPGTGDYVGRSFSSDDGENWLQAGDFDEDGFEEVFLIRAVTDDGESPSVCDGDITLSTQAEVDAFDCTEVAGHLEISDGFSEDDITDLSPLSELGAVGGDLGISGNGLLSSLAGLESLTSVGGTLSVVLNGSLSSLAALSNLTSVEGSLSVIGNSSLPSLAGLENITTVGGDLIIGGNPMLTSLEGLDGLSAVSGDVDIGPNEMLISLVGLENLTTIGGGLEVEDHPMLGSLGGLEGLEAIGGTLRVAGNVILGSLVGLEGLASIGGELSVSSNPALVSLNGLEGLETIGGGISIFGHPELTSLVALGNLSTLQGGVSIQENGALESLAGLEGITFVGGLGRDLVIRQNASLTSLEGLNGLTTVENDFAIDSNPVLESLDGLGEITSIGDGLGIFNNPMLESLTALASLTEIGPMTIQENSALESLAGLEGLTVIGGTLVIAENASLTSLESLGNLTSIESALAIFDNPALESLDGLEGVTTIGGELLVVENATLSDCACGLGGVISGNPPMFAGVGGMVTFENNAPDGACTSPQVVLDAFVDAMCMPVATEPSSDVPVSLALGAPYPNPVRGTATVRFDLPEAGPVRLALYDVLGREVAALADEPYPAGTHEVALDAARLASGLYIIRLKAEGERLVRRLTVAR